MKVLLFNNSGFIRTENDFNIDIRTGNFAKELQELGNTVTFFGQILNFTDFTISKFGILENGIKVIAHRRRKIKIINYIFLYLKVIPAIIRTDFVYIFYPGSSKYVALIAKILGKKFGLYIRGMVSQKGPFPHWLYKNAFTIFTVADFFTTYVNMVARKDVAHTIRPMITFSTSDIIENRVFQVKKKYKILYLGRLSKDKGITELLYALFELLKRGHQFTCDLVGSGEFMDELRKLAKQLNLEKVVSFRGAVYNPKEIKEFYTSADIYILPTHHEGFPRTLYEAMIFSTPIITTFVGGIPCIMKDNYNCKKIFPKSVESIVTTLGEVLNNYLEMAQLARNATNTMKQILNPNRLTHAQDLNMLLKKING